MSIPINPNSPLLNDNIHWGRVKVYIISLVQLQPNHIPKSAIVVLEIALKKFHKTITHIKTEKSINIYHDYHSCFIKCVSWVDWSWIKNNSIISVWLTPTACCPLSSCWLSCSKKESISILLKITRSWSWLDKMIPTMKIFTLVDNERRPRINTKGMSLRRTKPIPKKQIFHRNLLKGRKLKNGEWSLLMH